MSSSLFGSLQLSANTLRAMQVGLQVTGNNIANANTPGYHRQVARLSTRIPTEIAGLSIGSGEWLIGPAAFVTTTSPAAIRWQPLYEVTDEQGEVIDHFSVCADEWLSSAGYRLLWYHSTRKVEQDEISRTRRVQRSGQGP